jgi:hypothetical protein
MFKAKITKAEVQAKFQDDRPSGKSRACYRMGNYHPIFMKIGTRTKKRMLSSKITEAEVHINFQDKRRRPFRNSIACYKMGIYHPISMNFGTQTQTGMLSSKVIKAEAYDIKISKQLNVKKRYRFTKETL